jgi:hypothetical protein
MDLIRLELHEILPKQKQKRWGTSMLSVTTVSGLHCTSWRLDNDAKECQLFEILFMFDIRV